MEETAEFLHQQERIQIVSLLPLQIAALLAVLQHVVHREADVNITLAAQILLAAIEMDSGISVDAEGVHACVDALVEHAQRG